MKDKVLRTIHQYDLIRAGDKIVVGVSGGPDSITLLHILLQLQQELKINLIVAHINHQIREEAKEDEEYVRQFCENEKVQCFIKRINITKIAKQEKIGIEEAGRIARYSFFEEIRKKCEATKIATAHTANDNAETVLMNILRGTGMSGLKGIEPITHNLVIRPLIGCEREEIEEYCAENNLYPKMDKTNFQNIYTRNKIRNGLIPYLKQEFNTNILTAINRLSDIIKEEEIYWSNKICQIYEQIKLEENECTIILDLKRFNSFEKVIKKRLIRYTINKLEGTTQGIEKIHIESILELCKKNVGNKYLIPKKTIKILIMNRKIFFEHIC